MSQIKGSSSDLGNHGAYSSSAFKLGQGCAIRKKQVLAQGLVAITKLLAQDSQLLAQVLLYYILAYKYIGPFSEANFGEFIDVKPLSRYQFLPDQIMDYAMLLL